ncbi:MAG: biopolymer transporter ExbD [Verrucomicrobiota bacterium]
MSLLQRRRKKPNVNIIPLMDVLTILIFFFLVSMQFKEMTTLNLTLPDIESAGQNEFSEKVTLSIDAEGVVYLEGNPIELDALKEVVVGIAKVTDDVPVLIRADKSTTVELLTDVMDVCRLNGLSKIRLQSK